MPHHRSCTPHLRTVLAAVLLVALWLPAAATEIVYRPVNPAFGGDPLNGPVLLNSANAQNSHKDASASASGVSPFSSLQQFTSALQNSILARVAGAVSSQVVDASGNLIPGIFTIGNIRVSVVSGVGVLKITTTDLSTGQSTTFEVPQ